MDKQREQFEAWAKGQYTINKDDAGEYWNGFTQDAWEAWQAALAARQPVGQEPIIVEAVGTVRVDGDGERHIDWLTEGGISDLEAGDVLMVSDRAITDEDGSGEVYAALPAQAVDLERARDEGHDGAIRYVLGYLNGTGDCGSTAYDEILNACGRKRIIRSAVEDGELEFTGLGRWVEMYGTAEDRALIDSQA